MRDIPVGISGIYTQKVAASDLASQFKDTALPPVYATPMMIRAMENAALNAIRDYLEPGESAISAMQQTAIGANAIAGTPVKSHATPLMTGTTTAQV